MVESNLNFARVEPQKSPCLVYVEKMFLNFTPLQSKDFWMSKSWCKLGNVDQLNGRNLTLAYVACFPIVEVLVA